MIAVDVENTHEIPLYKKRDLALVRGEGVWLFDDEGRRYLDMMSNYGVAVLGHGHPAVTAAIGTQAETLVSCHQSFYNDARARFEETLLRLLPASLTHLSFANSGAEAIEAALKYARAATARAKIIATKRSYHGRTMGALSVTGEPKYRGPFEPLLPGCEHVAYGDLDVVEQTIADAAAVIVEPIQGESGVRLAPPGYLQGLRALCDRHGALLIFDEVQTALRTGYVWAWQHEGSAPDIMALSKPLANGLPIGVTAVSERVAQAIPPGSHGSTFAGNPLCCAAGIATLEIVARPEFQEQVRRTGSLLMESLRSLGHPLIREVRGRGLMVAVELKRNASPVLQAMQRDGVLAIPAGSTNVRFLPPLIVAADQVRLAVETLARALESVVQETSR